MGIKFLGTPLKQFDQLCDEEEVVMISIQTFKKEDTIDPSTGVVVDDRVQTGGWGVQIFSSKDIFQFDGDAAKVYAVDYNKRLELQLVN